MNGRAAMLSEAFLDWWFAPWELAPDDAWLQAGWPLAEPDLLARRDGYRVWCQHAGLATSLPALRDPGWEMLAGLDGAQLHGTARLLGGVLAARAADLRALDALDVAQRRWCSGVASVQPLAVWQPLPVPVSGLTSVELAGLAQLAHVLEAGFAGLWPRLRLLLAPSLRAALDALMPDIALQPAPALADAARMQRCWSMCQRRQAQDEAARRDRATISLQGPA